MAKINHAPSFDWLFGIIKHAMCPQFTYPGDNDMSLNFGQEGIGHMAGFVPIDHPIKERCRLSSANQQLGRTKCSSLAGILFPQNFHCTHDGCNF